MTHHNHDGSQADTKVQSLAHDLENRVKSGQDVRQAFNSEAHTLRQLDSNQHGLNGKQYKKDLQSLSHKLQQDGILHPMHLKDENQHQGKHHHGGRHHQGAHHRAGEQAAPSPAAPPLEAAPPVSAPRPPERPTLPSDAPNPPVPPALVTEARPAEIKKTDAQPDAPVRTKPAPPEQPLRAADDAPNSTQGGLAHLKDAVNRAKSGGDPVNILALGDSHTHAGIEPAAIRDLFKGNIAPDKYEVSAKVGASIQDPLRNPQAWIDSHIGNKKPDLVILNFGSNDAAESVNKAAYKKQYENFISTVQKHVPGASILVVGPTDGCSIRGKNKGKLLPGLGDVVEGQREAAAAKGVSFFDQRAAMGGAGSIYEWNREGKTADDRLHFTAEGYRELGKKIFDDIRKEIS